MNYKEELLKPISDDSFCGVNLEDDSAFQNFFFTAQGVPERFDGENTIPAEAPDWRSIEKQAMAFLEQSKDLKLISVLAQSLVAAKGLIPFSECLQAQAQLLEAQWETIFPLLDEDDGDPLERVASFSHLNDPFVINALKVASLANVKGAGNITLVEIEKAESDAVDASLNISQIKGVFREINTDEVQLFYMAVAYSLESLEQINRCLIDKAGHEYTVNFEKVSGVLSALKAALEKYAHVHNNDAEDSLTQADEQDDDGGNEEPETGDETSPQTRSHRTKAGGEAMPSKLHSREDVERCLGLINEYYERYEPSSPIPVLVNRAKKLVHKGFLEIVQDIYPDALASVQQLGGIDPEEESTSEDDDDW